MVHIFFYKSSGRLSSQAFDLYLQQLPNFIQKKILAYKNWQDAERSLAGNILLKKGLGSLNISGHSLDGLKYSAYQKPYFENHSLNFNISHSGQYTICAISQTHQVGIDVEEINDIPLTDFTDFFYDEEWQAVLNSPDRLHAFYSLWTKKEAFLKVIGSGLNVSLNQVVILNNTIAWENVYWLLQEVKLDPTHICHLCTNEPLPPFEVTDIHL